jgi:hypothetical protein
VSILEVPEGARASTKIMPVVIFEFVFGIKARQTSNHTFLKRVTVLHVRMREGEPAHTHIPTIICFRNMPRDGCRFLEVVEQT